MPNEARSLGFHPADGFSAPAPKPSHSKFPAHPSAKAPLPDISVDAADSAQLTTSPYHAIISVVLPSTNTAPARHPNFLPYLAAHVRGRGTLAAIDRNHTLVIAFSVPSSEAAQMRFVERFGEDVAKYLDLPPSAVTAAGIVESTSVQRTRAETTLGMKTPVLKLV